MFYQNSNRSKHFYKGVVRADSNSDSTSNLSGNFTMIKQLFTFSIIAFAVCTQGTAKPNILLILADDLGYNDLSVQGSKQIKTPNIDRIFNEGIRFTNGYVTNSVCAPSRAGLLTGKLGSHFGFEGNLDHKLADMPGSTVGLPLDQKTIADHLGSVGYKNYCIGKWHLGNNQKLFHPLKRGFHEFYGLISGSRPYWAMLEMDPHKTLMHNHTYINETAIDDFYITDNLTGVAADYIKQSAKKKETFFMYLSYTSPHGPMHAKESDLAKVQHVPLQEKKKMPTMRRIYCAMVQNLDDNVGVVLATLDELGIKDDTIIVFLSDNGGPTYKNGSNNWPLQGKKGTVWEGGLRIPFGISWPNQIAKGQIVDTPVISADLLPTFVAVSGTDEAHTITTDGVNLMPLLSGNSSKLPERTFFWRRGGKTQQALRYGKYKYVRDGRKGTEYLFNLEEDITERKDLSHSLPELVSEKRKKYNAWQTELPEVGIGIGAKASKK